MNRFKDVEEYFNKHIEEQRKKLPVAKVEGIAKVEEGKKEKTDGEKFSEVEGKKKKGN